MYELQKYEQYFFDSATVHHLADIVSQYSFPCCLCAPAVGQELERRGIRACTLDIDQRFAHLRGFRHFDLNRPEWLGETFGVIVCDPPVLQVPLRQVFNAVRMLSRYDYTQPLLMCYVTGRAGSLLGTFSRFGLERIDYQPGYVSVQACERNETAIYGNLGVEVHARLAGQTVAV